jgi:hypothetical protein
LGISCGKTVHPVGTVMQSPPGLVNQAVTSAMLSQYNRADEAPVRVSQYNVMLSSTWSGLRIFQSALVVTRPTPSPGSRHRVRPVSRPGSIRVSEALLPESGNMPSLYGCAPQVARSPPAPARSASFPWLAAAPAAESDGGRGDGSDGPAPGKSRYSCPNRCRAR